MNQEKWDRRFMEMAENISHWSKDPSTKVGAVIADQKIVVSVGYNGFPADVEDKQEWYEDRDKKLSLITHGEINALNHAARSVEGCTLYTYPFLPCSTCAGVFSETGIARVVSYRNTVLRWQDSIEKAKTVLRNAGIEVVEYFREVRR